MRSTELLASLQLEGVTAASRSDTPEIKARPVKKAPRARPPKAEDVEPRPVRATRSNAARTAALTLRDPEAAARKRKEDDRLEQEALEQKKKAKHA